MISGYAAKGVPQSAAQVRVLIPVVRSLRTSGTHTRT